MSEEEASEYPELKLEQVLVELIRLKARPGVIGPRFRVRLSAKIESIFVRLPGATVEVACVFGVNSSKIHRSLLNDVEVTFRLWMLSFGEIIQKHLTDVVIFEAPYSERLKTGHVGADYRSPVNLSLGEMVLAVECTNGDLQFNEGGPLTVTKGMVSITFHGVTLKSETAPAIFWVDMEENLRGYLDELRHHLGWL